MTDDKGRAIQSAGPSIPVEITGLAETPTPGDEFDAVADERMARQLVEQRKQAEKDAAAKQASKVTLDNLFAEEGEAARTSSPSTQALPRPSAPASKSCRTRRSACA